MTSKMKGHDLEPKLDAPTFDIFDSSPQRPLVNYGGALGNDSVDKLVNEHGDINFSRKRDHPLSNPNTYRDSDDEDGEPGSKRYRHSNWPLKENTGNEARPNTSSVSKCNSTTPSRASRFIEASMHDRPSEIPPSLFVRKLNSHLQSASVDHLMEEYIESNNKPLPPRPISRSPERKMQPKATHQAYKVSGTIPPSATPTSTLSEKTMEENRQSGVFRFGRSMASSFNPLSLWQKVSRSWGETKQELVQEAKEKKELQDRQAKAEQVYATLKRNGQLGAQGSQTRQPEIKIFTPGYNTSSGHESSSRDSGIVMDFDSKRSSMDTLTKIPSLMPPVVEESARKSRGFHIRTPSFQDLKKIASEVNLHKRSVSASRSPEKEEWGASELRRSASRKDLMKQAKLSRRVSDLEGKLEAARMELHSALGQPPADSPFTTPRLPPRPKSSSRHTGTWKRAFAPALPTLLSENLLPDDINEDEGIAINRSSSEEDEMFGAVVAHSEERPKTRGFSGDGLYLQPNEPLISPAQLEPVPAPVSDSGHASESVADMAEPCPEPVQASISESGHAFESVADMIEPSPGSVHEVSAGSAGLLPPLSFGRSQKIPRKAVAKKRKSVENDSYQPSRESLELESEHEDSKHQASKKQRTSDVSSISKISPRCKPNGPRSNIDGSPKSSPRSRAKRSLDATYRPGRNVVESDSDWEEPKSKTLKKKRPSDISSSPKANRFVDAATKSSISDKKASVLKKPQPISKETEIQPATLETVHEETTTTSTASLKDAPSRPTAYATPAHPGNRFRSRSRSPTKSPHKPMSVDLNRTRRSMSPPPSSRAGTFRLRKTLSPDNPVSARPGDDNIPPMPSLDLEILSNRDEFEWPDDVF